MENKEDIVKGLQQADSVSKRLFAIMNEEEDIDAYYEKTPEEMMDIITMVNARFPDKKETSYDPMFAQFGQICLNGYHTFGVDFLKLLSRRTDEIPEICYKGLIDLVENLMIENQDLAMKLMIDKLPEEKRIEIMKSLSDKEDISDEEFFKYLSTLSLEDTDEESLS